MDAALEHYYRHLKLCEINKNKEERERCIKKVKKRYEEIEWCYPEENLSFVPPWTENSDRLEKCIKRNKK